MQKSKKRKIFSTFSLHFLNLDSILNLFRKEMTVIADLFLTLRTPKNVVRQMSKKNPFRGPFYK